MENTTINASREDGVKNILPMTARLKFAKALVAERDGNPEQADEFLNEAIQLQEEAKANGQPYA